MYSSWFPSYRHVIHYIMPIVFLVVGHVVVCLLLLELLMLVEYGLMIVGIIVVLLVLLGDWWEIGWRLVEFLRRVLRAGGI